jgi:hypothetical protein
VEPKAALEAAARLGTLLSEFDPAAAAFLESNEAALRALFANERWPQFQQLVAGYAFDEAAAELTRAAKGFPTV